MLAAASFTTTMFTANRVATIFLQCTVCICFWWCNNRIFIFDRTQITPFNFEIFLKWGIVLLFWNYYSTMLMNAGFPLGIGLGSIVST
jgi:hypothetical protein